MYFLAIAFSRMTASLLNFSNSTWWLTKALRLTLVAVLLIIGIMIAIAKTSYNLNRQSGSPSIGTRLQAIQDRQAVGYVPYRL